VAVIQILLGKLPLYGMCRAILAKNRFFSPWTPLFWHLPCCETADEVHIGHTHVRTQGTRNKTFPSKSVERNRMAMISENIAIYYRRAALSSGSIADSTSHVRVFKETFFEIG
jgi:hypothetical protein